jgi:hypothetical protein
MTNERQRQREYDNLRHGLELKLTSASAVDIANQHLITAATWFERNLLVNLTTATEDRYLSALGYPSVSIMCWTPTASNLE